MTFPLWYFLVPYAVVMLGTATFMFFNVYHVAKFGLQSFGTTALVLFYLVLYLAVLALSASALLPFDWSAHVALTDIVPFTTGSSTSFGL